MRRDVAAALGIRYDIVPIESAVLGLETGAAPAVRGMPRDVTEENLQARARGTILMAISNKFGSMVMTTGNKSEMSVGYATLYGDMNGGFNPIKDLYKTRGVSSVARCATRWKPQGALGPDGDGHSRRTSSPRRRRPSCARTRRTRIRCRPTTVLDDILERLVEQEQPIADIVAAGYDRETVTRVERMLNLAEYKRRQAAPGVKVTLREFRPRPPLSDHQQFRDPGTPLPKPDLTIVSAAPAKSDAFDF